jgi:hypothetical protein
LELLDTQAVVALVGEQAEQAHAILVPAVEQNPTRPVLQLHLAAAFDALRDDDSARQCLLTALAAGVNRQVLTPRDRESLKLLQQTHKLMPQSPPAAAGGQVASARR